MSLHIPVKIPILTSLTPNCSCDRQVTSDSAKS